MSTRSEEQEKLFRLLDLVDEAYQLTDWAPIREHLHVAKVEAERHLGFIVVTDERKACA